MLTSRGLTVVLCATAALGSGLVTGSAALVLLGAAAGALVVGAATSIWLVREPPEVGSRVELPPRPLLQHAAAAAELTLTIAESGSTGSLLVEDPSRAWVRGYAGDSTRPGGDVRSAGRRARWWIMPIGRLCRVAPSTGDAPTMSVAVPTGRRGLLVLRSCRVWRTDGLALFARRVGATPPVPVLVCPKPHAIPGAGDNLPDVVEPADVALADPPDATTDDTARPPGESRDGGDEWTGLREYVPGDRLAAIHWPLSVRRGRLLARELSSAVTDLLTVIVDLSTDAPVADVDRVVRVAAGIGIAALRQGRPVAVGVWHGGRTFRVASTRTATELLCLLALVETTGGRWRTAVTLRAEDVCPWVVVFSRDGEVCMRSTLTPAAGSAMGGAP